MFSTEYYRAEASRKPRKRSSSHRRRRRSLTKRRRRPSKEWTGTRIFRAASSQLDEATISSLWDLNKSLKSTPLIDSSDNTACWSLVAIWATFLTGTSLEHLLAQVPVVYETLVKGYTESPVIVLRRRETRHILFQPSGFPVWFELDTSNRSADVYHGSLSREDLSHYERGVISKGDSWTELARRMYGDWYVLFDVLSSLDSLASNRFYRSVMMGDQIRIDKISLKPGEFLVVHVPHHVFIVYCEMELQYRLIDNSFPNGVSPPQLTATEILMSLQGATRVYQFKFREYPSPNKPRKRRLTTEEVESIQEMSDGDTREVIEGLLNDLQLA